MKRPLQAAAFALAAWPAVASASDMTGLLTFMTLLFVVAPLTLIHLLLTLVFALTKLYRKQAAAVWHALAATLAPLAGMVVTVMELSGSRHAQDRFVVMLILAVVLALAALPLLIHAFQKPVAARG